MNILDYIDNTLPKSLKQKNVQHKERFSKLFKARYLEILPSLIKYKNVSDKHINVDFLKVEVALRNGYDVVIGETKRNDIQVIGTVKTKLTSGNPTDLWSTDVLNHNDIDFIIPDYFRLDHYKEITHFDGCRTGNFVVLRNKTLNYTSDLEILEHYTAELAEIVLSRFSISMQVKINTLFFGDLNDQTIQDLISEIYNGNPFVHMSKLFDPDEQIHTINNGGISSNFQELKREYQNKISELNNMLGINSLAVEKASGVSDTEAESNRAYTTSNANIYLDARNNGLQKLNSRYGTQYIAMYDDDVISEMRTHDKQVEKEGEDNANNNETI